MGHLPADLYNLPDARTAYVIRKIVEEINGHIQLSSNLGGQIFRNVSFPTANQDVKLTHTLGLIRNYIILRCNTYARFRVGGTPISANSFFLQCDIADTVCDIFLFR